MYMEHGDEIELKAERSAFWRVHMHSCSSSIYIESGGVGQSVVIVIIDSRF